MKRHGDRNGHVRKMPTKRNALPKPARTIQSTINLIRLKVKSMSRKSVQQIQIQINTLSQETPHQLRVHLQIHSSSLQEYTKQRSAEKVQIQRYCYSTRPGPNTGYENRTPNRALGTRTGGYHDSKRQDDDTTPYLWTCTALSQLRVDSTATTARGTATEEPPEAFELDVTAFHLYF